jgi:hypothetical protein
MVLCILRAGITAAAGTRLALSLILVKGFKLYPFQWPASKRTALLFFVTTSSNREWVICAPAAILRRSGHFSGPFSGVEPLSSVTRQHHGSHVHYHRKLIRQTLERHVAGTSPCDQLSYSESTETAEAAWFCSNKCIAPRGTTSVHVLALELPQVSK